jgi:hypothetical protein
MKTIVFGEQEKPSCLAKLQGVAAGACAIALLFGLAATAWAGSSDENPYWALQSGGGLLVGVSSIANAAQDRFNVDGSGPLFDVGLARMHENGSPSFSFAFTRMSINVNATGVAGEFSGYKYQGSGSLPGFLATKYFSFIRRNRVSAGIGLGGGVGPQLSGTYKVTEADGTVLLDRKFSLKQLSATPLFAITFRSDFRITKQLSIGPYAGIEDGLPVLGGMVRFGLTR